MEGSALGVRAHPGSPECSSRWTHKGLSHGFEESMVRYYFKDDSTQRIFCMDESEIEFQDTGSSDSKDDEQERLKAQDEDSEVRLQNGSVVFEKFHNSVVVHLGCDRAYKALKLSGHNWVGMKKELKSYIAEYAIRQKIKWQ